MNKTTLAALALVCSGPMIIPATPMLAQETSPTATADVYNFDKFSPVTLMHLFKNALDQGRKYPPDAEFEAEGGELSYEGLELATSKAVVVCSIKMTRNAQLAAQAAAE